jgi:hypothetical protein
MTDDDDCDCGKADATAATPIPPPLLLWEEDVDEDWRCGGATIPK